MPDELKSKFEIEMQNEKQKISKTSYNDQFWKELGEESEKKTKAPF